MDGALAMIEREYRKFRRTPRLIVMTMVMPILQLIILGYAFGGVVKRLRVGLVDQDHGVPALKLREMANAVGANAQTFELQPYADLGQAVHALRDGAINGVLAIPPDFSRRALTQRDPHIALIEDNTDSFVANTLAGTFTSLTQSYRTPASGSRTGTPRLEVVEVYPYIPYIQYLLPGSVCMSIFMMVMMGGGIIYIDDKMRGLHEGYLVTPITRFELIIGFTVSGAAKAIVSGVVLMTVGSLVAGIADPFAPMRLVRLFVVIVFTSMALMSMMFLIMVRMNDPLLPRAMFGVLNTVLYFPSGAVYPTQAFPGWMRAIAAVDPFTYSVHAMKCLLLKNTGFGAILPDLTFLLIFSIIAMTGATLLFRRSL